jgi:bifunctional N-acetylglucosamine-1-phosphate-uridyltransferase/glucosamine-1-phosphate-acetyltransferase GlmU-like protein
MNQPDPTDIDLTNWRKFAASATDPARWTAVVPAAGRGTRLGYDLPKILYPIAERPILAWLIDLLGSHCGRLVFVLSPEGREPVERALPGLIPGRFDVVVQEVPTGMGDAVKLALGAVRSEHVTIVWGDQVALRPESVDICMRLHQGRLQPDVTCPVVLRERPYIHFDRDDAGRITGLRQAREGDVMPDTGESDTGFFCFRTEALRGLLGQLRDDADARGRGTGEFNLLPVIPLAARRSLTVLTPRIMTLEETIGVNSRDDAMVIEGFIRDLYVSSERQSG